MSDIKVPRHSPHSKVEKALKITPMDGNWHKILTMGQTSAEQTARAYNVPGANWQLGYDHGYEDGDIVSYLYAKWVG